VKHKQELAAMKQELQKLQQESKAGNKSKEFASKDLEATKKKLQDVEAKLKVAVSDKQAALQVRARAADCSAGACCRCCSTCMWRQAASSLCALHCAEFRLGPCMGMSAPAVTALSFVSTLRRALKHMLAAAVLLLPLVLAGQGQPGAAVEAAEQ
jgi:hypothetical protein